MKLENLGTIDEVRKEFDKTIVMACRDDKWYFLIGGNKNISNRDVLQAYALFTNYVIELHEGQGKGIEAIDTYIELLWKYKESLLSGEWGK